MTQHELWIALAAVAAAGPAAGYWARLRFRRSRLRMLERCWSAELAEELAWRGWRLRRPVRNLEGYDHAGSGDPDSGQPGTGGSLEGRDMRAVPLPVLAELGDGRAYPGPGGAIGGPVDSVQSLPAASGVDVGEWQPDGRLAAWAGVPQAITDRFAIIMWRQLAEYDRNMAALASYAAARSFGAVPA